MHLLLSLSATCVPRTLFTIDFDVAPHSLELFQQDGSSALISPYYPDDTHRTVVYSLVPNQEYTLVYQCTSEGDKNANTLKPGLDRNFVSLKCSQDDVQTLTLEMYIRDSDFTSDNLSEYKIER